MLSKFISVNTEPNPREQLNAINIQDEGVVEPEPEPRKETVVSKGQGEVDQNTNKSVNVEYKPRVPYPNAIRKDRSDEKFGELTLRVGDETITLQACTSGITSNSEGNGPHQFTKTDNITLQKLSFKEVHEPRSNNDRGHTHEERRLQIEELDEWRVHKLTIHDKPKLRQNEPDTSPNQLKVGDKVLLDVANPHIVTTTPNEEIPLTVLSIFPFGIVEVSHPKFSYFKHTRPGTQACLKPWTNRGRDTTVRYGRVEAGHDFPKTRDVINPHGRTTWPWVNLIDTLCHHQEARRPRSYPQKDVGDQVVMTSSDDPSTIQFRLGSLVRAMSVPEFGVALGLYTDEFMEEEDMNALPRNNHISPSLCWKALAPLSSTYDPSRSKASAFGPSLHYLHAILAHTLIGRRESTCVVNTHDAYYLWCMANANVTDLAYFIAFATRHQTERHQKGAISIGPYVMRLAKHFGLSTPWPSHQRLH
ncbi:hypothetical protein GOBAR_AA09336 [Gossypium barbadense]|uniref:Uncharacterized protein n=1 Tax=Gossypium barbadense TaxID=3634 RepID=A0A2P5Y6V7_GOSBA|nr:hypothetical protein GOBAR_AA09336 [Gossypium barbadense]